MRKENLFMMIHQIDELREEILQNKEPSKEYKIIEILADIDIFLKDRKRNRKYKVKINEIKELKDKITNTFTIDTCELKKVINDKQKSKFPVVINKKMSKIQKEREKAIRFLKQNGYLEKEEYIQPTSKMENIIKKMNIISQNIEKLLKI